MKKRWIVLLSILVVMSVLIAGCGNSNTSFARGTIEGGKYSSEYMGLSFTLPSGWSYFDDSEIAEIMEIDEDALVERGSQYSSEILNNLAICDMGASDDAGDVSSIALMTENLNKTTSPNASADDYIAALKEQLADATMPAYTIHDGISDVKVGKYTYRMFFADLAMSAGGEKLAEQYYLVRRSDNYIVLMAFTVENEAEYLELLSCFSE